MHLAAGCIFKQWSRHIFRIASHSPVCAKLANEWAYCESEHHECTAHTQLTTLSLHRVSICSAINSNQSPKYSNGECTCICRLSSVRFPINIIMIVDTLKYCLAEHQQTYKCQKILWDLSICEMQRCVKQRMPVENWDRCIKGLSWRHEGYSYLRTESAHTTRISYACKNRISGAWHMLVDIFVWLFLL